MLENWIEGVDPKLLIDSPTRSIGKSILINGSDNYSLENIKIAIISDKHAGNIHWRKSFYQLFNHFPDLKIADLGSLRKNSTECLTPVIKELLASGIFPIVIAQDESLSESMFVSYKTFGEWLKLLIVDEKVRYSKSKNKKNYVNKLVEEGIRSYIMPSILGYQIHFTDPQTLDFVNSFFVDQVRLGNLTNNLNESEPIIRDADIMLLNLGVIKSSEASAVLDASPNGLTGFEACQLCRFAGFSDKLTSAGLFGYSSKHDTNGQTAQLIAQMVWYIIDGFYHRLNEFPISIKGLQSYIIEQKSGGYPLKFWKSKLSGRWWMQIPGEEFANNDRHALIPCAHQDYVLASKGELPDRLFHVLQKNR
ncbi:MAG: hypothetical protein JNK41_01315 [Saprospiraceae bacterium]|jgi:formiminoglutamase|nr:hypothetical protein [Saprospiraceae bacterium]